MKRKHDKSNLLWMDLEMTGLDPNNSKIIEVGIIVTDFEFNEITTYEAIVKQPQDVIDAADPWVKENMSELLGKSVSEGRDEQDVISDIVKLINDNFEEAALLSGNSIHQDRRFIRMWWQEIEKLLHYRMLDVSSWKVYMSGRFNMEFRKAEQHRALEDIRGSIEELQYYLNKFRQGIPS